MSRLENQGAFSFSFVFSSGARAFISLGRQKLSLNKKGNKCQ